MIIVIKVDIQMFLEWENNSGKFQNNAINDVKQISLSHVIKTIIKWNRSTTLEIFCHLKIFHLKNLKWAVCSTMVNG